MLKRVLLFYITFNSGHYFASLAISNALRFLDKSVEIKSVDVFNYTSPITERLISKGYLKVINHFPFLWKWMYDNPKFIKNTDRLRKFINSRNAQKIKHLLDGFNADAIVCTQAYPCGMVAEYKKIFGANFPLIAVLTDHAPHSYWFYDEVDYYVMPSKGTKDVFLNRGVSPKKIKEFGIPVDFKFGISAETKSPEQEYHVNPEHRTILIMGGSQGIGPINLVIKSLDALKMPLNIIVVTGSNYRLYQKLAKKSYKNNVLVFGYTDRIDKLMEISDLLITKPGGITTSEALCKSLPMIIVHPIPGQESFNADFLLRSGSAIMAEDYRAVSKQATRLLNSPEIINNMADCARRIAKPEASLDIARLIFALSDN